MCLWSDMKQKKRLFFKHIENNMKIAKNYAKFKFHTHSLTNGLKTHVNFKNKAPRVAKMNS